MDPLAYVHLVPVEWMPWLILAGLALQAYRLYKGNKPDDSDDGPAHKA